MSGPHVLSGDSAAVLRKVIADRLSRIMAQMEVSRAQLAAALGATEARVHRIMKGSNDLTAAELIWVAKTIGCSLRDLTGRE